MKTTNRWHSIVALVIVTCLLAVPVSAFGKKGKDHFDKGMKYEQAQQWEKAAQEFTLALAADPANRDYQLHYRGAIFNASQTFMKDGKPPITGDSKTQTEGTGTPQTTSNARPQETPLLTKSEVPRVILFNGDL